MAIKILEMDLEIYSVDDYLNESIVLQKLYDFYPENFIEYYDYYHLKSGSKCSIWFSMQAGEAALSNIIEYRKKYSDPEIIYILSEIINCLILAQKKGISHGDIKLADIVLFKKNNKIQYKLIDFGLSIVIPEGSKSKQILESQIKGLTPNYAAPELLKIFSEDYNEDHLVNPMKLDIYSVGILGLYLMGLTFNDVMEIKNKKRNLKIYQEYPSSIDVIKETLIEDPNDRISYTELVDLLKFKQKKEPDDDFPLSRFKENHFKSMKEEDLEKYVSHYIELKNFESAKIFALHCLEKLKNSGDNRKIANCLEKCGEIEEYMKNWKKALGYINEALELMSKSDNDSDMDYSDVLTAKKRKLIKMKN